MAQYTVSVIDQVGKRANATFDLRVINPLIINVPIPTYKGIRGQYFNYVPITATGNPPILFTLPGNLPGGISYEANGLISGSASNILSNTLYTVNVTDVEQLTGNAAFYLRIVNDLQISLQVQLYTGFVGAKVTSYYPVVRIAGTGNDPILFSLNKLVPAGLTHDVNTGLITGVPTAVTPNTEFLGTVTDNEGLTDFRRFFIIINARDRSLGGLKANVLVGYDAASATFGYGGSTADVEPTSQIYPKLNTRITNLGYVPSLKSSYGNITSITDDDLYNNYSHIWDIGYATPLSTAIKTKYKNFLKNGGSVFLLGENATFNARNNTIADFVREMGGGASVAVIGNRLNFVGAQIVDAAFRIKHNASSVTFSAPGSFTNYGTGTPVATGSGITVVVCWKSGSLTEAPQGQITALLDVNYFALYEDANFTDNIVETMQKI